MNQAIMNPENTIFAIGQLMGLNYSDKSLQSALHKFPYNIVSSDNDKPLIQASIEGKSQLFTPEAILTMILHKMKVHTESFLGDHFKNVVVSVPASYTDVQRQAIKK